MINMNTIRVICIITGVVALITIIILESYKKNRIFTYLYALSALIFIITLSCTASFGMSLLNNDITVNEDITASYEVVEHQVAPTSFVIVKSTNGDKSIEFSLDDTEIVEGDKYEWQDVVRTYKYGFIYQPDDNVKHRLIIPKKLPESTLMINMLM